MPRSIKFQPHLVLKADRFLFSRTISIRRPIVVEAQRDVRSGIFGNVVAGDAENEAFDVPGKDQLTEAH